MSGLAIRIREDTRSKVLFETDVLINGVAACHFDEGLRKVFLVDLLCRRFQSHPITSLGMVEELAI